MPEPIIITQEIIERCRTPKGGYDAKTLKALGVGWPPQSGWRKRIIGQRVYNDSLRMLLDRHTPKPAVPDVVLFQQVDEVNRIDGVLHFDGSCWPNPGPNSKCGFILVAENRRVEKTVELGQGTNNTAEYQGIIHGMKCALENGVTRLEVYGDSEIVIRGVSSMKAWKGGKPHLELLKAEAQAVARRFARIEFHWVPRDQNSEADALSTALPPNSDPV